MPEPPAPKWRTQSILLELDRHFGPAPTLRDNNFKNLTRVYIETKFARIKCYLDNPFPLKQKKYKNVPYLWWSSVVQVTVLVRVSYNGTDLVVECGAGGCPGEGVLYRQLSVVQVAVLVRVS